jgi:hypothetical protein
VKKWEGIDTHAGQRLSIIGNQVFDCLVGIALVASPDEFSAELYAPQDITVIGNTVDSRVSDGSRQSGIKLVGASGVSVNEYATGVISGNIVRGHGNDTNGLDGAIQIYCTRGVVISGNVVFEASPNGIALYHDNLDFVVSGNTITDTWTNSRPIAVGITTSSTNNKGFITDNTVGKATKVATLVSTVGIRLNADDPSNVTVLGPNRLDDCATKVTDMGLRSTWINRASNIGFYGAVPVPRAAAVVTPTAPGVAYVQAEATAMKTAVDAIRTALKNVGITL